MKKVKVKDLKRIMEISRASKKDRYDRGIGTDELNSLMHEDERHILSLWQGKHWDDAKGG